MLTNKTGYVVYVRTVRYRTAPHRTVPYRTVPGGAGLRASEQPPLASQSFQRCKPRWLSWIGLSPESQHPTYLRAPNTR